MADNIFSPRRREDFFDERGDPTLRFIRWVELVTGQTNDSDVSIDSGRLAELYPWIVDEDTNQSPTALFDNQAQESNDLTALFNTQPLADKFEVIEVTGTTHTTAGNEILICTNTSLLTVTLNATADHKEEVIIVRQSSGGVNVTAVKKISGQTIKTILRRYSAPHHIFTTEADSWSVI